MYNQTIKTQNDGTVCSHYLYILIVVAFVLLVNLGFRLHLKKIFKSHGMDLDGKPDNKEDKKEEEKS